MVRSLPSGPRRVGGAGPGPDNAVRQTEVYYNGVDHYDGSDAEARDRFGAPVLPKRIKKEERDQDGDVRLNPLWVPLDEVDPGLLITGNRDAVWLYTVTDEGRVILGTEDLSGIVTPEQFDALLAGMREKDPDLTAESLRRTLDGLGHTGVAAGFAGGGETAGRTLPGRSRVSGEFRWSEELRSWVVNDKSGRYMSETVRPGLDAAEAADWLTNVAALFSERLGVVVRTDQVKTAAAAPPPAPPTEPAQPPPPAPPPPPPGPKAPPSEEARRRWIAGQVSADDLPGDPPGFTGDETVTLAELRDAGIGITPERRSRRSSAEACGAADWHRSTRCGCCWLAPARGRTPSTPSWPRCRRAGSGTRPSPTSGARSRTRTPPGRGTRPSACSCRATRTPRARTGGTRGGVPRRGAPARRPPGGGRDGPRTVARLAARLREILGLPPLG